MPVGEPDNGVRANETVDVTLGPFNGPFAVMLDWLPREGCENFTTTIPVFALIDDAAGDSLLLRWRPADRRFDLYDGTVTDPVQTQYRWRHHDNLKFAITSDGVVKWFGRVD